MDRLPKCGANYAPLSPVTFLDRAASVYANRTSVIYGRTRFTWKQTFDRCRRLASSLHALGISKNDVVSVVAPNIPALYEMHFAVPMAGAVLNTINTRLDVANVAKILTHSEAKAFFVDHQYARLAVDALKTLINANTPQPLLIVIDDVDAPTGLRLGNLEYEQLIATGNPNHQLQPLQDEWDPITLNYTSGTTSAPKGVVYSHRGAYLSTTTLLLQWGVSNFPVYLWSLPMFHCNGWTFTWGVAARGGTNVCIRNTAAADVYSAIASHKVTHMCCAPIVFNILLEANSTERRHLPAGPVHVLTGGAPPPAYLLEKVESLGFNVTHAYGLTEATGPALVCEWQPEWNELSLPEKSRLKARQGVSALTLGGANVVNSKTLRPVERDGMSMGEIVLKGSSIMKGYYKNEEETNKAFANNWFWTGDVGVVHSDGYIEIRDRSKDVIISGGENISSIEVEKVLYSHPKVVEAAVVAMPHPRWGESPCGFVAVKGEVREEELVEHCRGRLAGFMVPKKVVVVDELPKTSTGKIVKFVLRERAKKFEVRDGDGEKEKEKEKEKKNARRNVGLGRRNSGDVGRDRGHEQVVAMSRL